MEVDRAGQKRPRAAEKDSDFFDYIPAELLQKRLRISPPDCGVEDADGWNEPTSSTEIQNVPLEHWVKEGRWPKEYFEPDPCTSTLFASGESRSRYCESSYVMS